MVGLSGRGHLGSNYFYYACQTRRIQKTCDRKNVKKDWIEEQVTRAVLHYVLNDETVEWIANTLVEVAKKRNAESKLAEYEKRLNENKKQIMNILRAVEMGIVTDEFKERVEELNEEKKQLTGLIEIERATSYAIDKYRVITYLESVRKGDPKDKKFQRQIINDFVRAVYLYDDYFKLSIDFTGKNTVYKCPFRGSPDDGGGGGNGTKSGSEAAEEIETRYQKLQDEIIRLSANVQNIESRLPAMDKELESKKKLKAALSQGEEDTVTIEKESAFVEKCLIALEKIKGANRITALKQINMRLQEAYKMLSDDYDLGRRIYIVQYDQVSMFQIITYFENQYQDTLRNMQNKGTVASLKAMGQSDEEIQETAILSCAQPNSTGQSKMNTLAFVKAILDFANEPQSGGIFEMTKAYPLLIDAPFGDIFDKNLEKSAMSLHAFTHQIILMLAKDSYRDVEKYVSPYVSTVHFFEKEPNEDHSIITVGSMEEI